MDALTVRERPRRPRGTTRSDGEAAALLTLLRLPGVGDRTVARLVHAFGSARGALAAGRGAFADVAGPRAARTRGDPTLRRRVERGLERCRRDGVRVCLRGGPDYPPALEALADPPAVVLLRGRPELLRGRAVAIVGSRRSTAAGRRTAEEIAGALAAGGVVTVSGLALGIDAAAHRGALAAGGDTIAVLGSGPDVPHPPSNRGLFLRIADEGLLVTEFLPGEPPRAHHFPRRNRILAALSRGVVVVEAALRSGALITVGHALDLGLPVGAVPGSIYAPGSAGTNRLIRDGAHAVLEPSDALALIGEMDLPLEPTSRPDPAPPGDPGRVWRVLSDLARTVDEVAAAAEMPAGRVLAALSELEMAGRVVREPGGRFRRRAGP